MSTIDEIMKQADNYARSWADAQASEIGHRGTADVCCDADQSALREMIAAALADAERTGAEAMRERAADAGYYAAFSDENGADVADAIRALPLPTGERPHLDDGDAARLQVRLEMEIEHPPRKVVARSGEHAAWAVRIHDGTEPDKLRAWREAVTLCAAAVGERMKGGA